MYIAMEMPLTLRVRKDGVVALGLPPSYRAMSIAMLAVLVGALVVGNGIFGPIGWGLLALVTVASLFEDSWVFDATSRRISHRSGLFPLLRRRVITLADAERVRVVSFIRGTVPGSEDEREEKKIAMTGASPADFFRRKSPHKRRYLCMILDVADGSQYFMDAASPRAKSSLVAKAAKIASCCGIPLVVES